jgi:hypothetical protein
MGVKDMLLGGSPGASIRTRLANAGWRALRTFLQGVIAAFPAAGPGSALLNAGYWKTFWVACLAAAAGATVAFLQNALSLIPDPGQKVPEG